MPNYEGLHLGEQSADKIEQEKIKAMVGVTVEGAKDLNQDDQGTYFTLAGLLNKKLSKARHQDGKLVNLRFDDRATPRDIAA